MIQNIASSKNSISAPGTGPADGRHNLKRNSLSRLEVLAQSVSVIAPSTVPAAILGLIFATAGNGVWLSFVLGMIGLVLVSLNINQFARRSASSGSLYAFIVRGLGPTAGVLGGWALLCGYTITGMSTLCGFSVVANELLGKVGIHSNPLILFALGTVGAAYIAFRDISLSAKFMLICESLALMAVLILAIVVWAHKGFAIDVAQVHLAGATPNGVVLGIVLVVFGFSGFESATSLGDEARDPLKTIPVSVLASVIVSGLFFTFVAYVAVLGFQGLPTSLDKAEAPLDLLARSMGLGPLGIAISIGVLLSFFSCTLASINGTARIVFSMARHRLFVDALGEAHERNETPYIAVALSALLTFAAPATLYAFGVTPFDAQGYFGTLCSFGFLLVYILISIAAPFYLYAIGQLNARAILYGVSGVAFMILPFFGTIGIPGSKMFPPPEFPNNLLFALFIVYMIVGFVYLQFQRVRDPKLIPMMKTSIEHVEARFQDPAPIEPFAARR